MFELNGYFLTFTCQIIQFRIARNFKIYRQQNIMEIVGISIELSSSFLIVKTKSQGLTILNLPAIPTNHKQSWMESWLVYLDVRVGPMAMLLKVSMDVEHVQQNKSV